MRLACAIAVAMMLCPATSSGAAETCNSPEFQSLDVELNNELKALNRPKRILCGLVPHGDTHRCAIICASLSGLKTSEREIALVSIVGAVGYHASTMGPRRFSTVSFTDPDLARQQAALRMDVADAVRLQRQAKEGKRPAAKLLEDILVTFKKIKGPIYLLDPNLI